MESERAERVAFRGRFHVLHFCARNVFHSCTAKRRRRKTRTRLRGLHARKTTTIHVRSAFVQRPTHRPDCVRPFTSTIMAPTIFTRRSRRARHTRLFSLGRTDTNNIKIRTRSIYYRETRSVRWDFAPPTAAAPQPSRYK